MKEVDPKVFGPGTWNVIHRLAIASEDESASGIPEACDDYGKVIYRIFYGLPCAKCRRHSLKYLEKHPIPTNNNKKVFMWSVEFHNAVNKRLKKPLMSEAEARPIYEKIDLLLTSKDAPHLSCRIEGGGCEDEKL